MFERFSERARRCLFFARYELTALGGEAIEPAHILLGLIRERRMQEVFASWNIPLGELRQQVEQRTPRGHKLPTSVEVPFAETVKRVLNVAAEEADRLLHYRIVPEHLLIALLRQNDPVAAQHLKAYGITLDGAREYLATHPPDDSREPQTDTVLLPKPAAVACVGRIMELVHELAQAESISPEGRALVERIDDELMILRQMLT